MPDELVGALQPLAVLRINNNEIRMGLAGGLINKRIIKVMTREMSREIRDNKAAEIAVKSVY